MNGGGVSFDLEEGAEGSSEVVEGRRIKALGKGRVLHRRTRRRREEEVIELGEDLHLGLGLEAKEFRSIGG